ncbi:hypothetical protein RRG08_055906 [Elysia crispata]|uniref:Uncharacterized protein n=1 Tax=Elysia crispata TaxID=231223 RepID=A0AAE1CS95_9GAST|nr:hypothetical protein RRG08_055906 [Elysia crispata]
MRNVSFIVSLEMLNDSDKYATSSTWNRTRTSFVTTQRYTQRLSSENGNTCIGSGRRALGRPPSLYRAYITTKIIAYNSFNSRSPTPICVNYLEGPAGRLFSVTTEHDFRCLLISHYSGLECSVRLPVPKSWPCKIFKIPIERVLQACTIFWTEVHVKNGQNKDVSRCPVPFLFLAIVFKVPRGRPVLYSVKSLLAKFWTSNGTNTKPTPIPRRPEVMPGGMPKCS